MTIDCITGIICAVTGKSPKTEHGGLSGSEAFKGLLHKALNLLMVLPAASAGMDARGRASIPVRLIQCQYTCFPRFFNGL